MTNSQTKTVAITGMNALPDNPGPGLAVARCLREAYGADIRIIGLGYDVLDAGLYLESICDASYLLPYPSAGEQSLLERMDHILRHEQVDILIPCLDAEMPSFCRLADQFAARGIDMMIPSIEQLRARNKDRLAELAARAGIDAPETQPVTSASFFYRCHEQGWRYPMVIKGVFYDAQVVKNADEGAAAFRRIAAEWGYPVLVQQYVEGHEVNLAAIGDGNGALIGAVMMRKQAVTDKGKAWSCVTIDDPDLLEASRRLARELRWRGPLEVEMLRDGNGRRLLIEINPRFPAWIFLAARAGVNMPGILVESLSGDVAEQPAPKAGMMMIRHAWETVIGLEDFEAMSIGGSRASEKNIGGQS